jgi:hypothetical protein
MGEYNSGTYLGNRLEDRMWIDLAQARAVSERSLVLEGLNVWVLLLDIQSFRCLRESCEKWELFEEDII